MPNSPFAAPVERLIEYFQRLPGIGRKSAQRLAFYVLGLPEGGAEEFAKAMGVSRQTISSLENGRYNPSIMLAYKIAKYFGMTIEEVFCFDEEDLK